MNFISHVLLFIADLVLRRVLILRKSVLTFLCALRNLIYSVFLLIERAKSSQKVIYKCEIVLNHSL